MLPSYPPARSPSTETRPHTFVWGARQDTEPVLTKHLVLKYNEISRSILRLHLRPWACAQSFFGCLQAGGQRPAAEMNNRDPGPCAELVARGSSAECTPSADGPVTDEAHDSVITNTANHGSPAVSSRKRRLVTERHSGQGRADTTMQSPQGQGWGEASSAT